MQRLVHIALRHESVSHMHVCLTCMCASCNAWQVHVSETALLSEASLTHTQTGFGLGLGLGLGLALWLGIR